MPRRRRDDNVEDEPRAAPARREVIVDDQKFEPANAVDIGEEDEQIVYSPIYPSYSPPSYEEQKGNVPDEQKSIMHIVDPNALPDQDELSTDVDDSDEGDEGDLELVRQEWEEWLREEREEEERRLERRLEEQLNDHPVNVFPTAEQARESERQKDLTVDFRTQMYEAGQAARDREHEIYLENQRNMPYTNFSHPNLGTEVRAIAQHVSPENPEMFMEYVDNNPRAQRALFDLHRRGRALRQTTAPTDEQRRGIQRRIDMRRAQSRLNAQRDLLEFERRQRRRLEDERIENDAIERRRLEDERIENDAIENLQRMIVEFPEHFGMSNNIS